MTARTIRERGRPRADWDRDQLIVRTYREWALLEDTKASAIRSGRSRMKRFHAFLVERHGRDYYRPDHNLELVTWEDGVAYKEALKGLVRSGELGTAHAKNCWYVAMCFFNWRSKYNPKVVRYFEDVQRLRLYKGTGDFPDEEDEDTGSPPFDIEAGHFHKIIDAARTVELGPGGRPEWVDREAQDYEFVMLAAYSGQRTQIVGLRWSDVGWDDPDSAQHALRVRTKGGKIKTLPLLAPLEAALRDLRKKTLKRTRMVFAWTSYPWDDKVPASGQCEYVLGDETRCPKTDGLKSYFGRERDEAYCREHHDRVLSLAQHRNQDLVTRAMRRIEEALHELHPDLVEEVVDPKTGAATMTPIHVHWHRFRKTLGTWYEELGIPEVLVAKIVGWKDLKTLREKYHRPGRKRLYAAASKVDLVAASRAAERGELDTVRARPTEEILREMLAAAETVKAAAEERARRAEERADRQETKLDEALALLAQLQPQNETLRRRRLPSR